jgi:hypothetical protein
MEYPVSRRDAVGLAALASAMPITPVLAQA